MGQTLYLSFITLLWLFAMGWLLFVIRPALNSLQKSTVDVKMEMEELAKPSEPQIRELTEEEKQHAKLQKRLYKAINDSLMTNPYERNRNRRNHG